MAEPPPQAGSIARREDAGGPPERARGLRALLAWLKLGDEPGEMAPALRVLFTFAKELFAKQIEQIPALGPLLSALQQALAEEDSIELDSQFAEILETSQQSRETLDALGALATAIYLEQRVLREHLESAGLSVRPEQLTAVSLSTALAAYRGRVARDYQYADHRGIEGGVASLPLDEVYVLPRLVPERSQTDSRERESRLLKDILDNEDLPPAERIKREEEFALLTGERWRALKEKEQGKTVGEALGPVRHAVVIGSPGVGKTAMTRFLARTCALGSEVIREKLGWEEDLTPVVLPLAGYADAKSRQPGLTLREHLDTKLTERGGDALREAIGAELRAGRVLVLFDGVDEIPDNRGRILVVKAVEQFLADHAANRFVVTSRPYGYVRLAGEIPHFQLPNFSPTQVKAFVQRWQKAFERWRHPDAPDFAQAGKQAAETLEEICRNPRVEELAANPLMLVIFALIRHERARLPEERVQLYNRAVNTLMDSWNRGRSLEGIDVGGVKLPLDRLVRVWSAIAEWTRRTKPTGVVHRAELRTKLIEILQKEELDEEDPGATAESYLNAAADRAGLLEERGKDIFAFWHPTFEEFLAAVELTTPSAKAIERILPLRDDPRWREVILLAVGYLRVVQRDGETATDLVRAIWQESPGPLEPLLHSHLRLTAACIADDLGVKRSLVEEVIVALGKVVHELPYSSFIESFTQTIRGVSRLRPSVATVQVLGPLASHGSWSVRMELTRLVGNVSKEVLEARVICEKLMRDSDEDVRVHAACGLLRTGVHSAEIWKVFSDFGNDFEGMHKRREYFTNQASLSWLLASLEPLLASTDGELRLRAAEALNRIERGGVGFHFVATAQVLSAVEPLLTGEDREWRLRAAELIYVRADLARVSSALEPLLQGEDVEWRWRAAELLSRARGDPAHVAAALEPLLEGEDLELRWRAAKLLSRSGGSPARVSAALEPFLEGEDLEWRWRAVKLLTDEGGDPARVWAALESWSKGESMELRCRAAELLIERGADPARVSAVLEPLLEGEAGALRWEAAELLVEMRGDPARVTAALEPWLKGEDWELRCRAADLLSRVGGDPARVSAALEPLLEAEDPGLRWKAAELLIHEGGDPARVLVALKPLLYGEEDVAVELLTHVEGDPLRILAALEPFLMGSDGELRWRAADLLSRVQGDPLRVVSALALLLTGSDGELRWRAAELLSRIGGNPSQVLAALEPLLTGSDGELRWRAAELLNRMGGEPSQVLSALEPLLLDSNKELTWRAAVLALPLNAPAAVEIYVRRLDPKPWASLACCQKVLDQQSLAEEEGQILAALVRAKPEETEEQQQAREHLFNWLHTRLSSQAPALPAA